MSDVNPKSDRRRYRSPLREAQAELTRRRVLDAALKLFAEQGYAATSIGAIAKAAGVAPQTIYSTYSSKRGVLDAIADRASKELFPLEDWEREYQAKVSDPKALLAVLVDMIGTFYADNPDVVALLRHGTGETDTAFADERLARSGPPDQPYTQLPPSTLRSDIDPKAAAAIVDALLAPQVFTRLVNDAGWSLDDYKRWVLDLIQYAILRDAN